MVLICVAQRRALVEALRQGDGEVRSERVARGRLVDGFYRRARLADDDAVF